ncbi:MAG: putative Ig domain-containing protein, partial [Terriglobales bacterium]
MGLRHVRKDLTAGESAGIPGHWTGAEATVGVLLLALGLLGLQFCGGGGHVAPPASPPPAANAAPQIAITTSSLPDATGGAVYDASLDASGGVAPLTWAVSSGALPTGVTMSSAGVVSGVPRASGAFQFTARVSDSAPSPNSNTAQLTLDVSSSALSLSLPRVNAATQGIAYTDGDDKDGAATGGAVVEISGGTGPYTCSLTSGSLPSGMTMAAVTPAVYPDRLCVVSGTPAQAGEFPLTIEVQDAALNTSFQTATFTVRSSSLPVISNVTATSVSSSSETLSWTTNVPAASKVCYTEDYDVSQCTPETDTAGVTAHAVTLTGLWQNWAYSWYIESRGVAGGSPQDYLAGTAQSDSSDYFTTAAAPAGTTVLRFSLNGPNNVMPGYPLIVGIYYGPVAGVTGTGDVVFTVTNLPPFTQVHWPDEQDNGGHDVGISSTTRTDDTLTLSSLGGNNQDEFEILTNVGGTTPVGNYTVTVTGSYTLGGITISTTNTTWNIGVVTPTFAASKATV